MDDMFYYVYTMNIYSTPASFETRIGYKVFYKAIYSLRENAGLYLNYLKQIFSFFKNKKNFACTNYIHKYCKQKMKLSNIIVYKIYTFVYKRYTFLCIF